MAETMSALMAHVGSAPGWGIGAVVVLLALLARRPGRSGRRTSD
jgi:hypothetical protein